MARGDKKGASARKKRSDEATGGEKAGADPAPGNIEGRGVLALVRDVHERLEWGGKKGGSVEEDRVKLVSALEKLGADSPLLACSLLCTLKSRRMTHGSVPWAALGGVLGRMAAQTTGLYERMVKVRQLWLAETDALTRASYEQTTRLEALLTGLKEEPVWAAVACVARALEGDLGDLSTLAGDAGRLGKYDDDPLEYRRAVFELNVLENVESRRTRAMLEGLWAVAGLGKDGDGFAGARVWAALDGDVHHYASPFVYTRRRFAEACEDIEVLEGQGSVGQVAGALFAQLGCAASDPGDRSETRLAEGALIRRGGVRVGDLFTNRALLMAVTTVPNSEAVAGVLDRYVLSRALGNEDGAACVLNDVSYVLWAVHRTYGGDYGHGVDDLVATERGCVHALMTRVYETDVCEAGWRAVLPKTVLHTHMHLGTYLQWLSRDIEREAVGVRRGWLALRAAVRYAGRCATHVSGGLEAVRECLDALGLDWTVRLTKEERRKRLGREIGPAEDPARTLGVLVPVFEDEYAGQGDMHAQAVGRVVAEVMEFAGDVCELQHVQDVREGTATRSYAGMQEWLMPRVAVEAGMWVRRVVDVLAHHDGHEGGDAYAFEPGEEAEEESEDEEEEEESEGDAVVMDGTEVLMVGEDGRTHMMRSIARTVDEAAETMAGNGDATSEVGELLEMGTGPDGEEEEGNSPSWVAEEDEGDAEKALLKVVDGAGGEKEGDEGEGEFVFSRSEYRRLLAGVAHDGLAPLKKKQAAALDRALRWADFGVAERVVVRRGVVDNVVGEGAMALLQPVFDVFQITGHGDAAGDAARASFAVLDYVQGGSKETFADAESDPNAVLGTVLKTDPAAAVNGLVRATVRTTVHARKVSGTERRRLVRRLCRLWRLAEPVVSSSAAAGATRAVDKGAVECMVATMHGTSFMLPVLAGLLASRAWSRVLGLCSVRKLCMGVLSGLRVDTMFCGLGDVGPSCERRARNTGAALHTLCRDGMIGAGFMANAACSGFVETVLEACGAQARDTKMEKGADNADMKKGKKADNADVKMDTKKGKKADNAGKKMDMKMGKKADNKKGAGKQTEATARSVENLLVAMFMYNAKLGLRDMGPVLQRWMPEMSTPTTRLEAFGRWKERGGHPRRGIVYLEGVLADGDKAVDL